MQAARSAKAPHVAAGDANGSNQGPGPVRNRRGGRRHKPKNKLAESGLNGPPAPAVQKFPPFPTTDHDVNTDDDASSQKLPVTAPKPDVLADNLTEMRFSELKHLLQPNVLRGIRYEQCTKVQAATLPLALAGRDVFARALTGTGKTAAFLVPTIDRLARSPPSRRPWVTRALILSPTRELAQQIAVEASKLLEYLPDLRVQIVVGGTNINMDVRRLAEGPADILVATPGRLIDHLQNHGLAPRLAGVRTLVLDEADRLLDQGFRPDIERILAFLPQPPAQRQTLLFSATVPQEVKAVAALALRPDHEFVSTVDEMDAAASTHAHVDQSLVRASFADQLPAVFALLQREAASALAAGLPPKFIVFFPTARHTGMAAAVFAQARVSAALSMPAWEIHSRLSQSARTRAADAFRAAGSGVLLSSDVTARGLDFPAVAAVLQAGLPANAEQYVHRLGRTARAGAPGRGILVLDAAEEFFMRSRAVAALPIVRETAPPDLRVARALVRDALDVLGGREKAQAYAAWLGYYKGSLRGLGWDADRLIDEANRYALDVLRYRAPPDAASPLPPLAVKTIGMMGLKQYRKRFNAVQSLDN